SWISISVSALLSLKKAFPEVSVTTGGTSWSPGLVPSASPARHRRGELGAGAHGVSCGSRRRDLCRRRPAAVEVPQCPSDDRALACSAAAADLARCGNPRR